MKACKSLVMVWLWLALCLTMSLSMSLGHADDALADEAVAQRFDLGALLAAHEVVAGSFVQRQQIKGLANPSVSEGQFTFVRGVAVDWWVQKPVTSRAYFVRGKRSSGSTIAKRINKVLLQVLSADALSGNRFDSQVSGGPQGWQLTLTPRRKLVRRHLAAIHLSGDEYVRRISIDMANGSNTAIEFADVHTLAAPNHELCAEMQWRAPCISDVPAKSS